jgi:YjbE family integral membrane protein
VTQIALTFFAVQLFNVRFVRIVGGALVFWMAVRLFRQETQTKENSRAAPGNLWRAIWSIVFANLAMSTDNVLALAGAAHGSFPLMAAGLGLSIPFVMFGSSILVAIMDRFPLVVYIGAAVLGQVGGGMVATDHFTVHALRPSAVFTNWIEAAGAGVVLVIGGVCFLPRRKMRFNHGKEAPPVIRRYGQRSREWLDVVGDDANPARPAGLLVEREMESGHSPLASTTPFSPG